MHVLGMIGWLVLGLASKWAARPFSYQALTRGRSIYRAPATTVHIGLFMTAELKSAMSRRLNRFSAARLVYSSERVGLANRFLHYRVVKNRNCQMRQRR